MNMPDSIPFAPTLANMTWSQLALYTAGSLFAFLLALYVYLYPYCDYTVPYHNIDGESTLPPFRPN
jgi:hypothetical protein